MTQIIERIARRTATLFGVYAALVVFGVAVSSAIVAAKEPSVLGLAIFIPAAALSAAWLATPLYRFLTQPIEPTVLERTGDWALTATEQTVPARRRWHFLWPAARTH